MVQSTDMVNELHDKASKGNEIPTLDDLMIMWQNCDEGDVMEIEMAIRYFQLREALKVRGSSNEASEGGRKMVGRLFPRRDDYMKECSARGSIELPPRR